MNVDSRKSMAAYEGDSENKTLETEKEVDVLQREYEWVLEEEVHSILRELHGILTEACKRFPVHTFSEENMVKPEKFLLSSVNGTQHVKCMATLMGDNICEAELTTRIHKQQATPVRTNIYPDIPWKLQQIQDAGNHLSSALLQLDGCDNGRTFQNGQQVVKMLEGVIQSLHRGRSCLALPKRKTLEELVKNPQLKALKPSLPNDTVLSFYVQAQKIILAIYQLYVNPQQKLDIGARYQAECSVPWLNDTLVLFTLGLQLCQQLMDKVTVFLQYEDEEKLLEKVVKEPAVGNLIEF